MEDGRAHRSGSCSVRSGREVRPLAQSSAALSRRGDRRDSEQGLADLWRQAIGVLGLFDTVLQDWVYPSVSVLLLGALFAPLPLTPAVRGKVATTAAIVAFAYAVSVYLVCYLSFTPLEANTVWGVQGRYFVPCLPVVAISVASVVNRGLDERIRAALAISAGVLSGSASIDAIVKADWHI
jgi:hypothetical protein